mmetsp:Transcript_10425/g.23852  ORF Transcript_10425/g.23852 Transcript_10425/m.23852 type:complete len:445 (-) Transcript_10425:89-1423(-)
MIENCSEGRTLGALLHANSSKNPLIRAKVASYLCALVESMGPKLCNSKDLERLFPVVVQFLSEGSAEPRQAGRRAMLEIHMVTKGSGDFDRLLRRCAEADIRVVEKVLAQEKAMNSTFAVTPSSLLKTMRSTSDRPVGEERSDGRPPRGRRSTYAGAAQGEEKGASRTVGKATVELQLEGVEGIERSSSSSSNQRKSIASRVDVGKGWAESPAMDRVPLIASSINSNDFRSRYDAVNELTELILREKQVFQARASYFVDMFIGRLGDNNVKVALAALQGVDRVVEAYGNVLESSAAVLVPAVCTNLSNTSPQIRTLASNVLESICSCVDPSVLAQPLCSSLEFGNQRARPALLERMRELVPSIGAKKPLLLHKLFLQSAIKMLDEHKSDVRTANAALVVELYNVLGDSMFNGNPRVSDKNASRLREIIANNKPSQPTLTGLQFY